jgi:23S rRNA (guanine745-N1)-methyltransferase
VANADRRLPLLDGAIDLIWSIHGRRQPAECARVLRPRGRLVVAVPAADDLVELRARVAGTRVERDRVDGVLADHDALFALVDRRTVRERHTLTGQLLEDLLAGTYRGARHSAAAQVAALDTLDVTLASDVLVFERR